MELKLYSKRDEGGGSDRDFFLTWEEGVKR